MKRPASASGVASRRKLVRVTRKTQAKTKIQKTKVSKKPVGKSGRKPARACCKPINQLTNKDLLFFHIPRGKGCFVNLRGCKSSRKGYMFEHIDFNCFAEHDSKIPQKAKRVRTPGPDWLSQFFFDPAKRRLVPVSDASALPERASGEAYRIEDNGGMPFICYVRDDSVSVFRKPQDCYLLEEDEPDSFDAARLIYTEEVTTLSNVVKTWIGIDGSDCKEHGNSILVHVPPATRGRCVTALLQCEGDNCHVSCTDLAGEHALSVSLAMEGQICTLVTSVKDYLQKSALAQNPGDTKVRTVHVKCFDSTGEEVQQDQPLKNYSQLTLKDCTQSYVYIGSEIYSFDLAEDVTAYYSRMGNSSVPYPVAVTPTTAIFMLDRVQVPREQLMPLLGFIPPFDWGDSYTAFYEGGKILTKTPVWNVTQVARMD